MSGTPSKRTAKRPSKPAGAAKKAGGRAAAKKSPPVKQPAKQRGARKQATKPAPTPPPAPVAAETTSAAVERALRDLRIQGTAKRAVVIATVRRLAEALDGADPTDRPKISKELAARWAELMAEANPRDSDPDWTTGSGAPQGGDAPQPGPADTGR